ncbi:unnamed protein product, partial [Owenia fusiformis]
MGVCLQTWRASIGCFNNISGVILQSDHNFSKTPKLKYTICSKGTLGNVSVGLLLCYLIMMTYKIYIPLSITCVCKILIAILYIQFAALLFVILPLLITQSMIGYYHAFNPRFVVHLTLTVGLCTLVPSFGIVAYLPNIEHLLLAMGDIEVNPGPDHVKLLFSNINSLKAHQGARFTAFTHRMRQESCHIAALCEVGNLTNAELESFNIEGFQDPIYTNSNRGILVYVSNDIHCQLKEDLMVNSDSIWIDL